MLTAARNLWRKHRFLFLAFITALVVTLFFAARLLMFTLYWVDPAHDNQPLEGWMTPRYVAHSYDLPPTVVRDVLELEAVDGEPRTLAELVKSSDLTLEEIQRRVDEAARTHKGGRQ
ncbi:hypothetical protein DES49_2179 [Halospina denitrificans]|uniref:Uncharacterized protein n=1 Tax=Halospina denitrificans TaxID=332522 RepID=A0A4R7JSX7_9GAMM|nr:hypothetical protein [Halospina denitrificans]TDT40413.1 hypothetical protein DES49_2179 [Halospina denitrificans]